MDKLNINDFPSLDGVSLIPTKTLQYIINIYNNEVEKEMYQFEKTLNDLYYINIENFKENINILFNLLPTIIL